VNGRAAWRVSLPMPRHALFLLLLAGACGTEPVVSGDDDAEALGSPVVLVADEALEDVADDDEGEAPAASTFRDDWLPPVSGRITSRFGDRDGGFHDAVDIASGRGNWVVAPADMRIRLNSYQRRAGRYLVADVIGEPYRFTFAHLSHVAVNEGQRVKRGEPLGTSGISGSSTGPHLHFRVERVDDEGRVAIDPLTLLREERLNIGR
jgi:murein DD-endopeptidase MepM/ murein hydrolase activator NlpD